MERLPPGSKTTGRGHYIILHNKKVVGSVAEAWEVWEFDSGISRLKYEGMQEAIDFVRGYDYDDGEGTQQEVREILAMYEEFAGVPRFFKQGINSWWMDNLCVEPMGPFDSIEQAKLDYKSCRPNGEKTRYYK